MSKMTDVRYGRGGGRFVAGGGGPIERASCEACGRPMTCGQPGRHYVCGALTPAGKLVHGAGNPRPDGGPATS